MTISDTDVRRFLLEQLPGFSPTAPPERLSGGLLNVVWRVPGEPAPVIVKYAPPHVAADPERSLSPSRLGFEARALEVFEPDGPLAVLGTDALRPPRPLTFDASASLLVMENCGDCPHLGGRLRRGDEAVPLERGDRPSGEVLGTFVGRLHRETLGDASIAANFDNAPVQATRHETQYGAVVDLLERAGVEGAEHLGAEAKRLGERLQAPGECLTMGDLWPRSLLIQPDTGGMRLIDWEFAHVGRPIQDLAHLAAHLWMHAHRGDESTGRRCRAWGEGFWSGYSEAIEPVRGEILTPRARRDANIHVAAEILVRAVGPFRDGYLYEDEPVDGPVVGEAVGTAVERLEAAAKGEELASIESLLR